VVSATVADHRNRAERTARESPWLPRLARLGLFTRGMLHVIVGSPAACST
jgi:hypothetical protein